MAWGFFFAHGFAGSGLYGMAVSRAVAGVHARFVAWSGIIHHANIPRVVRPTSSINCMPP